MSTTLRPVIENIRFGLNQHYVPKTDVLAAIRGAGITAPAKALRLLTKAANGPDGETKVMAKKTLGIVYAAAIRAHL